MEQEVKRDEMLHIFNTNVAGVVKTTQHLGVLHPGRIVVNIRETGLPLVFCKNSQRFYQSYMFWFLFFIFFSCSL
jgi:hypothetical protein